MPRRGAYRPRQPKEKTLVRYDDESERHYIMHRSKKIYLFDKRFKNNDTPTQAYLKQLEQHLKDKVPAAYLLNSRALNTTQVISLLSKYDIDIPKFRNSVDKIRRTFLKHKNRITFDIIDNRSAFDDGKHAIDIQVFPKHIGISDVTDDSIKAYFAAAVSFMLKHIKQVTENKRDDWVFMLWLQNDKNDYKGTSGKPVGIDGLFIDGFLQRIKDFIISGDVQDLMDLRINLKGFLKAKGGAINEDQRKDLFGKNSLITIKNDGNSCFWHASTVSIHKNHKQIKQIKEGRGSIRNKLAMHMCEHVGFDWNAPVAIEDIPLVEEAINKEGNEKYQYYVLNIDELPQMKHTGSILDSLMYKGAEAPNKIWLLYDNGHFHTITDIKKFLRVEAFCCKCCQGFYKASQATNHVCTAHDHNDSNTQRQKKRQSKIKTARFPKDKAHFLMRRKANWTDKTQRYIVYDVEANPRRLHVPNKVIAKEYLVPGKCDFGGKEDPMKHYKKVTVEDNLIAEHVFNGNDCIDQFCERFLHKPYVSKPSKKKKKDVLSTDDKPDYTSTTVIAHNQKAYDARFILEWCQKRSFLPDNLIRSGSKIQYMYFRSGSIRFIDSLNFFLEPLRNLSKSYGIDTVKGWFPHKMNRPKYWDYVGDMPNKQLYEPQRMMAKERAEFEKWYNEQTAAGVQFNFQEELQKYCNADVDLLAKAVFEFRDIFIRLVQVDPFAYVTLASLCKAVFIANDLPEKSIVGNEHNKTSSKVAREWLYYIQQQAKIDMHEELPIFVEYKRSTRELKCNVLGNVRTCIVPENVNFKYYFIPPKKDVFIAGVKQPPKDDFTMHITVDGYNSAFNTAFEFNGCKWHGCPKCNVGDDDAARKYEQTMERIRILELGGIRVKTMWECEWSKLKKSLPNRRELELKAELRTIKTRDAFAGGRTEVIKKYHKCVGNQVIRYKDITSEYPTVNAVDTYAVGFRKYRASTTVDDIINDKFIGLVKCRVEPPKDLYLPVLPCNIDNKLLFTLTDQDGTWTTLELKKAIEKGYQVTEIYSATEYTKMKGLMRTYVERFLKMKIENEKPLTQEECDEINTYHNALGLNIDIRPENTRFNPGMRKVAKICLNSLWGKFAQRPCLEQYAFTRNFTEFTRIVSQPGVTVNNFEIISKNLVEVRYMEDNDYVNESEHISEAVAAFTTSNARLRLYAFIDWLHYSQVLYYDTDSCIYLYDPDNPDHINPDDENQERPELVSLGKGLGQWSDELEKGEYITEFVATGPKSYAYKTNYGKRECKAKGLTLDVTSAKYITLNSMKKLIDEKVQELETAERHRFNMDKVTKQMRTTQITKKLHDTVNEKRNVIKDEYGHLTYDTVPFGFDMNLINYAK